MKATMMITGMAVILMAAPPLRAQHDHSSHDQGSMGMRGQDEKAEMMGHSHEKSELHSGMSMMTKAHHFETVYMPDGIRLYVYDSKQGQSSAKGIEARASLMYNAGESKTIAMLYHEGAAVGEGKEKEVQLQDYLFAPVNLTDSAGLPVRVKFTLGKLPGEKGESVEFMQPFDGLVNSPYTCPMHPDVWGKTRKSECPLCGMFTSAKRMPPPGKDAQPDVNESTGGHDQ